MGCIAYVRDLEGLGDVGYRVWLCTTQGSGFFLILLCAWHS